MKRTREATRSSVTPSRAFDDDLARLREKMKQASRVVPIEKLPEAVRELVVEHQAKEATKR